MNIKGLFCLLSVALCCSCSSTRETTMASAPESTTNAEKTPSIPGDKVIAPKAQATQVRYDR